MSFKGEEQSKAVQQRLKHWLNTSINYSSRLHHQGYKPKQKDVPDEETLLAQRLPEDYDSDPGAPSASALPGAPAPSPQGA